MPKLLKSPPSRLKKERGRETVSTSLALIKYKERPVVRQAAHLYVLILPSSMGGEQEPGTCSTYHTNGGRISTENSEA